MQIHQGHQGVKACSSRAREFVFWVNINSDIEELVKKCDLCQSQWNSTSSIQKYVSEVPPHPWHMVGSDLFYFQRINFLVVVDYFSKYLFISKIPNSTSSAVIKELGMIFLEFGKPQVFRSDNGPCYSSQEFNKCTYVHLCLFYSKCIQYSTLNTQSQYFYFLPQWKGIQKSPN